MNNDISSSGFLTENGPKDEDVIVDRKKIHESASGFNELWEFRRLGKLHILKCLKPTHANDPFYRKLLLKEFDIAYKMEHVHICRTLGWEKHPALGDCILMEYIDGETLESFIQKGKLTTDLAVKFINEICDALQYIHSKQIIHRDLKPTNILVTHNGKNVKLIDFGLSDGDDYHTLKIPAGTRQYIAPEQMHEDVQVDARADIYSLGVIIWKMGKQLRNRALISVANKCRRHNREKRYSSASEIKHEINSKRIGKSYFIIPAVGTVVAATLLLFFVLNRKPDNSFPGLIPAATSNNNYVVSNKYQQILLNERSERLYNNPGSDRGNSADMKQDSIKLVNSLREALDEQFPLKEQKQSPAYTKALEEVQKEATRL